MLSLSVYMMKHLAVRKTLIFELLMLSFWIVYKIWIVVKAEFMNLTDGMT